MSHRILSIGVRALAGAAVFSMAVAPIAAQPGPPAVGVNAAVHNNVQLRRAGQAARPAVLRERVVLNDEISTGAASQLQILLLDRSTFTVGANARIGRLGGPSCVFDTVVARAVVLRLCPSRGGGREPP